MRIEWVRSDVSGTGRASSSGERWRLRGVRAGDRGGPTVAAPTRTIDTRGQRFYQFDLAGEGLEADMYLYPEGFEAVGAGK